MKSIFRTFLALLALVGVHFATVAVAQVEDFEPVTQETLLNPDPADWIHWRRTLDSWGYSPLDQINAENVGDLRMAWGWAMEPGAQEVTPLVYNGVMYLASPGSVVQALDAATGDLIWEYRRQLPEDVDSGSLTRGLAIYDDLILHSTADAALVALNASDGSVVWETQVADYQLGYRFTSGPIVADGKVFAGPTGCTSYEESSCWIVALDVETGEELWRTRTIAFPGEEGGDTWGDLPPVFRSGGDPWIPGSYDPELDLLYWGVQQAKPWARASRGTDGAALYTNSTLALDPDTGEIVWYRQYIPGETHDMDQAFEHILVELDGEPGYMVMGKNAILWRGNRETGESLPAFDMGYQDLIDVDPETGEFTGYRPGKIPEIGEAITQCPSTAGFKSWRSMAYSPNTNAVYIPLNLNCDDNAIYAEVELVEGGGSVGKPGRNNVYHPDSPDGIGEIAAMDVDSGEILWSHRMRTPANTSTLPTAGGIVFAGDWDRHFWAFDEQTGEVLWETRLPNSPQGFPVTYEADGRQYVAVPVGVGGASWSTSVVADLAPEKRRPNSGNAVIVFALPE